MRQTVYQLRQATQAAWVDQSACIDVNYSVANGLPLSECTTRAEIYEHNKKRGISNYIDPFVQLFCVRFNNAPKMGDYWIDRNENSALSTVEIKNLQNNDVGFGSLIFGNVNTDSNLRKFYLIGD